MYRGKCAIDQENAGHLMSNLDWAGANQDIIAAARALKAKGYEKVALTGFCMGGALSITAPAFGDEFACSVPFYGCPDLSKIPLANIKCPVLGMFGTQDKAKNFSDPDQAHKLEAAAQAAGVNFKLVMWEADHSFMNHNKPAHNP
jgi:carboxymethylenebutenolidase